MPESPEEYFRRISDRVEDLILTAYPNPNRIGCPGEKRVKEVAARSTLIKDEDWEHITHCSPCYAEFIEHKKENRRQAATRRMRRSILIAAIAGVCVVALTLAIGREWIEARRPDYMVQLRIPRYHVFRGPQDDEDRSSLADSTPLSLPTGRLRLHIILPDDNPPGRYEIKFFRSFKSSAIATVSGTAELKDNVVQLTVIADLNVSSGKYFLGLRTDDWSWRYYDLVLVKK
jgi:hypothetical protein